MPVIPTYPELAGLGYAVVKRTKGSTGAGIATSGREIRVNYWAYPQFEWDLTYEVLNDQGVPNGTTFSDIQTLMGFVENRGGSFAPFYFKDDTDCQVTAQALGTGGGGILQFPMIRTYGLGETSTQPVGTVDTSKTLNVYVAEELQDPSTYAIDTTTPCGNFLKFNTDPGAGNAITADFTFLWFCRFKDDVNEFENTMQNLWRNNKITIFSLKG